MRVTARRHVEIRATPDRYAARLAHHHLKRYGVTLQTLWDEYQNERDGLAYE